MPNSILSQTARAVLTAASQHPERLAMLPARLPAAAQRSVVQSLLKAGLLEEVEAKSNYPSWRQTDADQAVALHITYAGLLALDPGPAASSADAPGQTDTGPSAKPSPRRRETVRRLAEAVTDTWDDDLAKTHPALASAVVTL